MTNTLRATYEDEEGEEKNVDLTFENMADLEFALMVVKELFEAMNEDAGINAEVRELVPKVLRRPKPAEGTEASGR